MYVISNLIFELINQFLNIYTELQFMCHEFKKKIEL